MNRLLTMSVLATLALTACDEKPAADEPKPESTTPEAAKKDAPKEPAKPVKDPKWEIQVEGEPTLAGNMVMKTPAGPNIQKYSLVGGAGMVSFDLEKADAKEPYLAQVGFNDSKLMCAKPLSAEPLNLTMLSREGDKHVVSGSINCRAQDGTKTTKKISGWFLTK